MSHYVPRTNRLSRRMGLVGGVAALGMSVADGFAWYDANATIVLGLLGTVGTLVLGTQLRNALEHRAEVKYGAGHDDPAPEQPGEPIVNEHDPFGLGP